MMKDKECMFLDCPNGVFFFSDGYILVSYFMHHDNSKHLYACLQDRTSSKCCSNVTNTRYGSNNSKCGTRGTII